ncbi:hypothetical protein, partial [Vibrio chagasii]|uniref:hypothetical protein n=1 Tax=Vibrio chagasii TaxID=170679 RepID=UPI001C10ADB0
GISALPNQERAVSRAELQARSSAKKIETISMNHTHDEYSPLSTLIYKTPDEVHRTFLSINHRLT